MLFSFPHPNHPEVSCWLIGAGSFTYNQRGCNLQRSLSTDQQALWWLHVLYTGKVGIQHQYLPTASHNQCVSGLSHDAIQVPWKTDAAQYSGLEFTFQIGHLEQVLKRYSVSLQYSSRSGPEGQMNNRLTPNLSAEVPKRRISRVD